MHTRRDAYTYICIYAYAHIYVHICTHMHICRCAPMHRRHRAKCIYTCTCICTCTHAKTHTYPNHTVPPSHGQSHWKILIKIMLPSTRHCTSHVSHTMDEHIFWSSATTSAKAVEFITLTSDYPNQNTPRRVSGNSCLRCHGKPETYKTLHDKTAHLS